MTTNKALCTKHGITAACVHGAKKIPDDFRDCDPWTVTLRFGRRRMTVQFFMGRGHKGAPPTVSEVMSCLVMDAASIDDNEDFSRWARELGYDEDSRNAERIFRACKASRVKLLRLLGDEYDTFQWADRD